MAAITEDVLTVWHLLDPRALIEFTGSTIWNRLPWALLSFGVAFFGLVAVYIIVKVILASCCFSRKYHNRYIRNDKTGHYYQDRHRMKSFAHVLIETLFFLGIFLVVWIASYVAGFNLFSSSLLSVGMGLVATYMFAIALQNMGAGYWIYVTDKVEEDQYLRFPQLGPDIHGIVAEMHPMYILLQRENNTNTSLIEVQVPMTLVISSVVIRDFETEMRLRSEMEVDPDKGIDWSKKRNGEEKFKSIHESEQPLFRPIVRQRTPSNKVSLV